MAERDDLHSTRLDGPTPAGGAYAIAQGIGPKGERATRETAVAVETVEYDARDRVLRRTYATLTPRPTAEAVTGLFP